MDKEKQGKEAHTEWNGKADETETRMLLSNSNTFTMDLDSNLNDADNKQKAILNRVEDELPNYVDSRNMRNEQLSIPKPHNSETKPNKDNRSQPCDKIILIENMPDGRHNECKTNGNVLKSETNSDVICDRISTEATYVSNTSTEERLSHGNIGEAICCGGHEDIVDESAHACRTSIQTNHSSKHCDELKQSDIACEPDIKQQNRLNLSDSNLSMTNGTDTNTYLRNDKERNNRDHGNEANELSENGSCNNCNYYEDNIIPENKSCTNNKSNERSNSFGESENYINDGDGDKDKSFNDNYINEDAYSVTSDGELKEALLTSFPSELVLDKELELDRSALSQSFIMPYSSQDKYAFGKESHKIENSSGYSIAYKNEKNHTLLLSKDTVKPRTSVVDSPWSYVVAFASFISQVLLGGYCYTGGLFYTIFRHEFPDTSSVALSWLCALPLTMWFGASFLGSMICNRYGPRACAMVGGLLAAVGLSLCYVTTNFYMLFICYGIVAGSGYGIQYVGFITSVNLYCKKHRSLVTILTTLGPTFGMSLYSFLVPYLYTLYSWTGALLIIGALALNLCACATVLFPIDTRRQSKKLFNILVLKEKYFALFCLTCVVGTLTNGMTILHLPSLIISFGLGTVAASMALMLFGITNCGAKLIFAGCGHFMQMDVAKIYFGSMVGCAIASALLPVMKYEQWVLVFVSMIGAAYCVLGGHYIEMVYELVGPERFPDAIGIAQLSKATGTIMAGPVCGFLYQASGNYMMTFYMNAGLLCFVCVLLVPILMKRRRVNLARATELTIKDPYLDDEP